MTGYATTPAPSSPTPTAPASAPSPPEQARQAAAGLGLPQVFRAILATSGAKVYTLVAGIASLALTARWLGPEGRGQVAAVATWAAMVFSFGYLSLGQVALHRAASEPGEDWVADVAGNLAFAAVVVTLLGWIVVAVAYAATGGELFGRLPVSVMVLGFLALPFLVWEQYGSSLLMALGALPTYNRAVVVGRTLGLAMLVITVPLLGWGVKGALVAAALTQATVALGGVRRILRASGRALRVNLGTLRGLVSGGAKLHLNAIGSFLFMNADILMLQYYRGATETGYYQLAVQLGTILLMPAQAASMVLFSRVAEAGPDGAWAVSRKVLGWMTALMVLGGALAALLAPWAIPFVAGRAFAPSVLPFQVLLLSVVGMTFSTVMAPQWIGRGLFWQVSGLTLFAGLLNVGINVYAIPRWGMMGATWATVASYAVALAANLGLALRIERKGAWRAA